MPAESEAPVVLPRPEARAVVDRLMDAAAMYSQTTAATTNMIWPLWTQSITTADNCTYATTTATTAWPAWVNGIKLYTADNGITGEIVYHVTNVQAWDAWNQNQLHHPAVDYAGYARQPAQPRNPIQALKEAARGKLHILKNFRDQQAIRAKADELLKGLLTEAQWQEWKLYSSVRIVGSKGGVYELGWSDKNTKCYRLGVNGEPQEKLCVYAYGGYPPGDQVATLLLALQTDEDRVLKIAIRHSFFEGEKERVKLRRAYVGGPARPAARAV